MAAWVIYPWLLSVYPIVYLFSINLFDVREDDMLEVVIVALIATTVLYAGCFPLIRDVHRADAITSVVTLEFLTYGHLYDTLTIRLWGKTY